MTPGIEWLLARLRAVYGENAGRIIEGLNAERATTLRVNTLKADRGEALAALRQAGLQPQLVPFYEDAALLPPRSEGILRGLPLYENGGIYLQSLSSMLPPLFLQARPGEDVLDMAAAPGGKTSQIAALTEGKAFITACEIQHIRAERLRANMKRLGCGRVTVIEQDARRLDDFLRFDRILLDAPCSGSGTLTLSDERSVFAFSERLVENSARLQRALLKKGAALLKKGGVLLYSTCSLLPEENEEAVRAALSLGLTLEPLDKSGFEALPILPNGLPGTLTVCPTEAYEGFFVAKLVRK
ncbi:MAG: RsmB/NOP family class I SAM-dependent RNA methyltransferase [Clostridia bacterium]|nr:RsmB/NOP family class I SAM-dependent RNA methyltransferase [Clostridia bacterium]